MVKNLIEFTVGIGVGATVNELVSGKKKEKVLARTADEQLKFKEFYFLLLQWIHLHQEGKSIAKYLTKRGYRKIAVYGMRELGQCLVEELKESEISVECGVDQNADSIYAEIEVFKPDDVLPEIDAMVVTAIHSFDVIEKAMKEKVACPIISLEEVIFGAQD